MGYLYSGIEVTLLFLGFCLCYRTIFFIRFKKPLFFLLTLVGVIILAEIRLITANHAILIETSFFCCLIGIIILAESHKFYVVALYPIIFMFYGCFNILCSYALCFILKIPYKEYARSGLCDLFSNLITILSFIILYLFNVKHNDQKEIRLRIGEYIVLLISVVSSFIVVAISQSLMEDDESLFVYLKQPFAVSVTALGFIMITGLLWISFLKNKSNLYKAENESYKLFMDKQESHVKDVIEADYRLRSFRHDINAHISVIEACLNRRDFETLDKYLIRMKQNASPLSSDLISGSAAIDAIVREWHERADAHKIRWNWKGKLKANIKIDLFDLCVLVSNILSNAVEAAEKIENEENRFIEVKIWSFHGRTLIIVSNSCIDETMKNKELLTSKTDKYNHGFGIKNIKRIVDDNKGEVSFELNDNVFKIEVIV